MGEVELRPEKGMIALGFSGSRFIDADAEIV